MVLIKFLGCIFSKHYQVLQREVPVLEALAHQILERRLLDGLVVVIDLVVGNPAQVLLPGVGLTLDLADGQAWLAVNHSGFTPGQLYQNIDNWLAGSIAHRDGAEALTVFVAELALAVIVLPALPGGFVAIAVASEVALHCLFAAYAFTGK